MLNDPGGRAPAPGPLRLVQRFVNTVDFENGIEELTDPAALEQALDEIGVPAGVRARLRGPRTRTAGSGRHSVRCCSATTGSRSSVRRSRPSRRQPGAGGSPSSSTRTAARSWSPGLPVSTAHWAASSGSSTPRWRTARGRDSRPVRGTSAGGCSTTARRTATAAGARCPSAGIASRPRNTGGERRRLPQPRVAAAWPRRSRIPRSRACSSSAPRIRSSESSSRTSPDAVWAASTRWRKTGA